MTEAATKFLDVSTASVATILVDDLDREQVVDLCTRSGLEYETDGDLVRTTLLRGTDDGEAVELLVDFDAADGVIHVHSRDYLDAYGLAPIASELLEALSAAESQSLFTYSISFDHPLVDFTTLVEHLDGEGVRFEDPTDEASTGGDGGGTAATDRAAPAADPDAVDGEGRPAPPASTDPTGPARPQLAIDLDGDRFELYEDGYLLPVDDASASAAAGLVEELNRRLVAALPAPPEAIDAAELPEGWAGPLAARHENLADVVEAWEYLGRGIAGADPASVPFDVERDLSAVAETILDTALSLVYAVDHCSPTLREQYYDRYVDAADSPLSLPLVEDGEPRDRERFVEGDLWDPEIERTAAVTRREIRDFEAVVASYDGLDIRVGQVWRHHAPDRPEIQEVAVIGRQFIGGQFLSLPVWIGEVRSVEPCERDETDDHATGAAVEPPNGHESDGVDSDEDGRVGQQIVIQGENLLELVEETVR